MTRLVIRVVRWFGVAGTKIVEGMAMIEWKYVKNNVKKSDFQQFESVSNFSLPESLYEIILSHNNGRPKPNQFDTEKYKGRIFDKLLSFNFDDKENVFLVFDSFKNELPKNLIAVAIDPFGNLICIDKEDEFRVAFWEHETGMIEVTKLTLPELFSALY